MTTPEHHGPVQLLVHGHDCVGIHERLHLPTTHGVATEILYHTKYRATVLTIFSTNCCPHVLIMSGKGDVCTDKGPEHEENISHLFQESGSVR